MPELPEVETVRSGLAVHITGNTFTRVKVLNERSVRAHTGGARDFSSQLKNATIKCVSRRGKFLWMPLELANTAKVEQKRFALVGHLGMSGQMFLRKPSDEPDKLTRVVISVETARGKVVEFRFIDQRIFGSLAIDELVATADGKPGGFTTTSASGKWWQNLCLAGGAELGSTNWRALVGMDFVLKRTLSKIDESG